MICRMRRTLTNIIIALAALIPAAAYAQPSEGPALSVEYNAAIVSDYRFRGISYTNRNPAVQGGVDITHSSGLFVGAWLSNIADYGGADIEVDIYGGYGGSLAGFDYTAGVYGYLYPDGRGVNYVELQSTIARTIGPVTTTLTAAYIPDQKNSDENLYLSLGGDLAIGETPFSLQAGIGRENGAYDEKWDWSAGLTCKLDALELSAAYVDSNYGSATEEGRNGRAAVVVSVKAIF
jgi:uncharacterized protein (TIGR02001 family)